MLKMSFAGKIAFILFSFCLTTFSYAQIDSPFSFAKKSISGLELMGLHGRVRSVEQIAYKIAVIDGKPTKGERANPITYSINADVKMEFDTLGRLKKETITEAGKVRPLVHEYDDLKRTETIVSTWGKRGEFNKSVYTYDSNGHIVGTFWQQYYAEDADFQSVAKMTLDAKGNLQASEVKSKGRGEINTTRSTFRYNNNGQRVAMVGYGESGKLWYMEKYSYDPKGRIREQSYFQTDTTKLEHGLSFKYDEHDNVIEKVYHVPNQPKKVFMFEYDYDDKGNWIRRVDYENGNAGLLLERTLIYY